jgi:hypothetical protein
VRIAVIARITGHHGDVRLRLGFLVQRDGICARTSSAWSQHLRQHALNQANARRVGTMLRLLADHRATEQLHAIVGPEDLAFDEPLVLQARPFAGLNVHRRRA